jgi:hypothetical protein
MQWFNKKLNWVELKNGLPPASILYGNLEEGHGGRNQSEHSHLRLTKIYVINFYWLYYLWHFLLLTVPNPFTLFPHFANKIKKNIS